jgi:hypothetical protein
MNLTVPFWFQQRQGKAEPAGTNAYQLTAPNLKPALISIANGDNGLWSAALALEKGGPSLAATSAEYPSPQAAWEAAFELYRQHIVI